MVSQANLHAPGLLFPTAIATSVADMIAGLTTDIRP